MHLENCKDVDHVRLPKSISSHTERVDNILHNFVGVHALT